MKVISEFFQQNWVNVLIPIGTLAATLAIGWAARRIIFGTLERWAARSKSRIDDLLVECLRGPFMIWVLILGLHLGTQFSASPRSVAAFISKLLLILWVISLTSVAQRLAGRVVHRYGTMAGTVLPVTSLTQNVARLSVVAVGCLILLNLLGVSITPILTALGVGGLAVALALQDTLANFFAGIYISVANQIRVGDYIKLESGEEGYVTDISWRSTSVRMLANNMIIIPNAKLAQAIVTNYHLPEKRMSLLVPISVSYDSDPELVERILIEEAAKGARDIPGLLAEPAPLVRFIPGFGASSLDFTLICQIAEFVDQYVAQHELRKRIFKRFRAAGIEIPFPIRTVYLRNEATDGEQSGKLKAARGHG